MATVGINSQPYTKLQRWETSEDGTIFLQMGQKDNSLELRAKGDSNLTLHARYKSERTSISINRDCISSAEVNTKTYPIYLIIGGFIFLYSLANVGFEFSLADYCSQPYETRQSEMYSDMDCANYIPFIPQLFGLLGLLIFVVVYIITKRGRIIFRVQSDADFRILIKSSATPSVDQMNRLVNAILFVPNPQTQVNYVAAQNQIMQNQIMQNQQRMIANPGFAQPLPTQQYTQQIQTGQNLPPPK